MVLKATGSDSNFRGALKPGRRGLLLALLLAAGPQALAQSPGDPLPPRPRTAGLEVIAEPGALVFSWETQAEAATTGFLIVLEREGPEATQVRLFVPAHGRPTGYGHRADALEPGTYRVSMREVLADGTFRAWRVSAAGVEGGAAASLQVHVE